MKDLKWQKIINPMNLNHQAFKIKFEIKIKKSKNNKALRQIKLLQSRAKLISLIHLETIMEMQEIFKNLLRIVTKKRKRSKTHIKINIK